LAAGTLAACHRDDAKSVLSDKSIGSAGGNQLPRLSVTSPFALAAATALALTVGGCENRAQIFQDQNAGGWFSKPMSFLTPRDWARPSTTSADLGPSDPVRAEDLVNPDGSCAPAAAATAQAAAPAAPPPAAAPAAANGGKGMGFEGGLEPGAGPGSGAAPTVLGGIALGMSECEAVRRAGHPSNVAISAGQGGERKVVLTYLEGPWPGIYTFDGGRLKEVEAAPVPEKPKAAPKKKRPAKHAKSTIGPERIYVQ
jgi:hypothetical protein